VRTLPLLLRHGLRLVFAGYNPSVFSAEVGHYYARPRNAFWRHLAASGLVERAVGPVDDAALLEEAGVGFTDLCRRPTATAAELTPVERHAGAARLRAELVRFAPLVVACNGRGVFNDLARFALDVPPAALRHRPFGPQPERIGATRLWLLPSSSGSACRYHAERLDLLRRLRRALAASG
jgi:TDG/mug DNA glycosylase family protein